MTLAASLVSVELDSAPPVGDGGRRGIGVVRGEEHEEVSYNILVDLVPIAIPYGVEVDWYGSMYMEFYKSGFSLICFYKGMKFRNLYTFSYSIYTKCPSCGSQQENYTFTIYHNSFLKRQCQPDFSSLVYMKMISTPC